MKILCNLFNETVVCPHILRHAFVSNDVIHRWFVNLSGEDHRRYTQERGCWDRMEVEMKTLWGKSNARKQDECDSRCKKPNESYVEYGLKKLAMIKDAYPDPS